jgi:hypothetical protein
MFRFMAWKLLQAAVVLAVIFANIHWQFTPNGYLAALMGVGAALAVTGIITTLSDWRRRFSSRP